MREMYEENFNIQKILEKMDKYTKFLERLITVKMFILYLVIL